MNIQENEFRQRIHIDGRSIDDILRLPCVRSCEKTSVAGIFKFRFYAISMAHPAPYQSAYTGDWLCQDYDNKWHVLNDSQYKSLDK